MEKYDIFISYSREDLHQVEPFVKMIEQKANVKCWIDWTGIESGSQFEDVIVRAIDSVDVVLFFISENSINSHYAKLEINYAYNVKKKVVPVILDGGNLRGWFLFKFGAVDFIDIRSQRQCDKLIQNLQEWCSTSAPVSTPNPIPRPTPAPAKTYKVGDYYNDGVREGIVFEVTADGRHGKIVSMKQAVLQWSSDSTEQKRLIGADSETNGEYNMAKVMARPDWQSKYPAFKWCADLGEGWYLPSKEELKTFTLNDAVHDAVNRTLIARGGTQLYDRGKWEMYWSSTERNYIFSSYEFCAWNVSMHDGYTDINYKSDYYYVRAVATFGEDILEDDVRAFVEKERKAREEADREAREVAARKASEEAERRRRLGIYEVGDYYNDGVREGVVFEVSADGRHGKIVSMKQSAEKLPWAINERKFRLFKSEAERLIGADSERDGAYNMAKVKAISGWETKYPAFKWCADLGERWYLPSKEELLTIYKNKYILNPELTDRLSEGHHWSSTEINKQSSGYFCAWFVIMSYGYAGNNSKSNDSYVRAVSAF